MKKNITIVIGICLALSLIFTGYRIKLSMPKEYYLPHRNNTYRDYDTNDNIESAVADIENITNDSLIQIINRVDYNRYVGIMTMYNNQKYFYLFERKIDDYYHLFYKYEMTFNDDNIYYKQIDNLVFVFGNNRYASDLRISVPNSHTYIGNEFYYQNSNIMICLLDNNDIVDPISIYSEDGVELAKAKKCE